LCYSIKESMKISFFKAAELDKNFKCSIHKTGKLGFTEVAIKKLDLENKRFVKIGKLDDEEDSDDLVMLIQEEEDEFTFKANKAGEYFYVNTKALFDMLNIDYKKKSIIYDIVEIEDNGNVLYKLKRREKERK